MAKKKDGSHRDFIKGPITFNAYCSDCKAYERRLSESSYDKFLDKHKGHLAGGGMNLTP